MSDPAAGRVRVLRRRMAYRGRIVQVVIEELRVKGRRILRESVLHPGAVVVVPILAGARLVFVRQYRRAVRRELLEFPAGTLEPGEAPGACARRELEEETGWRAGSLQRITWFYTAPGILSEQMRLYVARDLQPGTRRPEADEAVRPVVLPLRSAMRRVRAGRIRDVKTIVGVWVAQQLLGGAAPRRRRRRRG